MNFKRILVAVNHSPLNSTVLTRALNLAQVEQANLMILHCLADITQFIPEMELDATFGIYPSDPRLSLSLYNETLQLEIQQATAWLQEYAQKATNLKIPTEYQHQIGDPGVTICNVAQQWNADLIILGRHDHSAITDFFAGSVGNYVIHHANCSVLVVKDQNVI